MDQTSAKNVRKRSHGRKLLMKLSEIQLDEIGVMSSWIADLNYVDNMVVMTLNNGRTYRILGLPEGMFRQWMKASSKGKYWHSDVRGNYRVSRV